MTVPVTILDDTLDELDETYFVNLANPVNATIADGQGLGTIVDDDAAPTLSIDDTSVSEAAGTATFTISLSAASGLDVSVSVSTADGSATSGLDYTAVGSTVITIPAGSTSVTTDVSILEDAIDEPDETYFVNLNNPVNAGLGVSQGVGTIVDNDGTPTLSIDDVSVSEGDGIASFTITLSGASGQDVSVTVATADDTATAGSDYTAVGATVVTIPAGSISVSVPVTILEDALQEPAETYFVNLTSPVNATIADGQGLGTISDNDSAGFTVTESDGYTLVFEDGSTDSFDVVLTAQPSSNVVIDVVSADTGEVIVGSSPLTFTPADWDTPQTVTVTGVDDPDVDGDQTTLVTLSIDAGASDDAFDSLPDQTVSVTTIDVDGSIRGTIWDDVNGDQTQNAGELGISSVQVYLDLNRDGILNAGEPVEFTANDGSYSFENVAPGEYVVAQGIPTGLAQTFPQVVGTAGTFAQFINNEAVVPTHATHAPRDVSRLFVVEKGFVDPGSGFSLPGRIRVLDLTTGQMLATPFLEIPDTDFEGEGGFVGLTFHPNYANNGKFYVYTSVDNGGQQVEISPGVFGPSPFSSHVREYTVSANDPNVADPNSMREILSFAQPETFHNGGWLGFGPDGYLYISSGDGGPATRSAQ